MTLAGIAAVALLALGSPEGREVAATADGLDGLGRIVMDAQSSKLGVPAVQFDHALHRTMFSCRVCHVELGFALRTGESQVSADSNRAGQHCGACHDGTTTHGGAPIFRACTGWRRLDPTCLRCHVGTGRIRLSDRYAALLRRLPRDQGGYVDWNEAERRRLVKPSDVRPGASTQKPSMKIDRNFDIDVKGTWLGRVAFSHRKHAGWNGCEQCHPEIFPVTKRGSAKYTMASLRDREFCGVCHSTVAFPISECARCHGTQR